jgi:hypothetical protein
MRAMESLMQLLPGSLLLREIVDPGLEIVAEAAPRKRCRRLRNLAALAAYRLSESSFSVRLREHLIDGALRMGLRRSTAERAIDEGFAMARPPFRTGRAQ